MYGASATEKYKMINVCRKITHEMLCARLRARTYFLKKFKFQFLILKPNLQKLVFSQTVN